MKHFWLALALLLFVACHNRQNTDITPHAINPTAHAYYLQAQPLFSNYDIDSTYKSIALLDSALSIDSLNPDYYGVKAKLLAELGLLDSALLVQTKADQMGAINGEYLFQLGLFQAAKDNETEARESFRRSNTILKSVLKEYPDSLGAFILQQAANALYLGEDSVYMNNLEEIKKQYPNRLLEIEMSRHLRPSTLVKQIKKL